ncbi:MAG: hypothetical protein WAO51_08760, partial [Bacillota bacterium]
HVLHFFPGVSKPGHGREVEEGEGPFQVHLVVGLLHIVENVPVEGVSGGSGVRGGAQGAVGSVVSGLIYMNGETDYLELSAYNSHSSALALDAGQSNQNYISIVGPF